MMVGTRSNAIGAFTAAGTCPLILPEKTLTRKSFNPALEHILDALPGSIKYIVMDNAPIHGGEAQQDIIFDHDLTRINLPPYSPDLNPMEHMWAWLKHEVGKENFEEAIPNVKELDGAATAIWARLKPDKVLVDYKRTLAAVIAADGEYTGG
jgi:transposase